MAVCILALGGKWSRDTTGIEQDIPDFSQNHRQGNTIKIKLQ